MGKKVKVVIIGAGSAGLSALRQVKRHTDSFVVVDHGPLGTKCARVGCMPSKALIAVANDYHRRMVFASEGIAGGDGLKVDIPLVLEHVRRLRDKFTKAMVETTEKLAGDKLISGRAEILSRNCVRVGEIEIETDSIVIAAGADAKLLPQWLGYGGRVFTSENIFEAKDLPRRIAVIGLGAIGLELGQALSRLGIEISGFAVDVISLLTDHEVRSKAMAILGKEFPMYVGSAVEVKEAGGGLVVSNEEVEVAVDAIIASVGVTQNIEGMGLRKLGVELDEAGRIPFNRRTMQVGDLPIFVAGDVNGSRPILHEAIDEGNIAGHNALVVGKDSFCRRTEMSLVFTYPQIARVGVGYKQLGEQGKTFVSGKADFSDQARAALELKNAGQLNVYADRDRGLLLGAEMICPEGEHLAHLLAMAIHKEMTVYDMLEMPFYHPTAEEGLRTALMDAARQLPESGRRFDLSLCGSCPEQPLS